MHKSLVFFALLFVPCLSAAVETKTISESGYQNLWLWQLSNTALADKEGITLARESKKEFSTPSLLWTMASIKGVPHYGGADSARIFTADTNGEKDIYTDTNRALISALAADGEGFIAASGPEAEFLRFDAKGSLISKAALSNTYIWDFVPRPGGGYELLTALPAQIYTYSNGALGEPVDFPDEEHLVRGLYVGNTLWVLSEKALYRKNGDKITAVAAFNGTAANFVRHGDLFYVIQSVTTPAKTPEEKDQVLSSLLSVTEQGLVSELLSLPGFYFTALSAAGPSVYVGADQYGLTLAYDTAAKSTLYSSLGTGKVLMILPQGKTLRLLTSEESALWTVSDQSAAQGEFISEVYDTSVTSQWGIFRATTAILPGTSVKFYVQSGVVKNPAYWGEWSEADPGKKITAAEGRYVRYKAVLRGSEGKSPTVFEVNFPYTQRNLPPRVEKLSTERRGPSLTASWTASDPNKDTLSYDIYLHEIGKERIKINGEPLSSTNYTFANEAFPSGMKKITVVASDLPSNAPESALTSELSTLPLAFDSEAPAFGEFTVQNDGAFAIVSFSVEDNLSPIKAAGYLINGRNPKPIRPTDEIFDAPRESFRLRAPRGIFLQFQVTDSAGNSSSKGLFLP